MAADGRSIPVRTLNRRRRAAVELRLAGTPLGETVKRTGLSAPTVINALAAYRAGGWEAIAVAPRGRGVKKMRVVRAAKAPQIGDFAPLMEAIASRIGLAATIGIPLSRLRRASIDAHGSLTSWFRGPKLASWLKRVKVDERRALRLPL